jgi:hypothetical protein
LYHVEGHDIAKRYLARFMSLDQTLVDENGAAAGGQTEHKGLVSGRVKGVDAIFVLPLAGLMHAQGGWGSAAPIM